MRKLVREYATLGFLAVVFMLLCSFQPARRSLATKVGIVSWRNGQGCLAIWSTADLTKTSIRMVRLLTPSPAHTGRVIGKTAACDGSGSDPKERYWLVDLVDQGSGAVREDFPAIGVLNFTGSFHRNGAGVSADVDRDGRPEYFRLCTSAEGVHYTAWTGTQLTGQRRWHQYFYLGYDTEPTCTAAEMKEDER